MVASSPVQIDLKSLLPSQWHDWVDLEILESISKKLTKDFLPDRTQIFKALEIDPDQVKIILLGQDPYPNPLHAMGLAFSVPENIKQLPASLKNIYIELKDDLGIDRSSGDLSDWADQGVLLLNTCLTLNTQQPDSHTKIGWQQFTESIIGHLSKRFVVGILWGNHAQSMSKYFGTENLISSAHPSPLSAYRGFFGSKPFSRSNQLLIEKGLTPIKW